MTPHEVLSAPDGAHSERDPLTGLPTYEAVRARLTQWVEEGISAHATGGAIPRVHALMPVSYTHLDVYKRQAVERARLDPAEIDDVVLGAGLPQGVQSAIGRTAALRAGFPASVAGITVEWQCASGLMAIGMAAHHVVVDRLLSCV